MVVGYDQLLSLALRYRAFIRGLYGVSRDLDVLFGNIPTLMDISLFSVQPVSEDHLRSFGVQAFQPNQRIENPMQH